MTRERIIVEFADASKEINDFKGFWLAVKLAETEQDFRGCDRETAISLYPKYHIEGSFSQC